MTSEELRIDSFLRLGYFIDYSEELAPIDFSRIDKTRYEGLSHSDLVHAGTEAVRTTFSESWQPGRNHVLPLSGGLDSRFILGALLEHTNASNLHTYTYGVPGSYDYEIGNFVAKQSGTQHTSFPLDVEEHSIEEELRAAVRTSFQGVLFHHPPLSKLDRLYAGALFWSGYGGETVAGRYLQDPSSATLEDAKRLNLKFRRLVRSIRLHRLSDERMLGAMGGGRLDPEMLSWDEQVLFDESYVKFNAPLVLFRGIELATPLINTPWMDFMLSVPNRYRLGQQLMIDIGRAVFPRLFDLPSKNRLGYTFDTPDSIVRMTFWLNRARKRAHQFLPWVNYPPIQYNDFNEGIRSAPGLRRVVRDGIEDLRQRGVCDWIDFDGIWRRHDRRIRNHGDALIILASLELIFKARESAASA